MTVHEVKPAAAPPWWRDALAYLSEHAPVGVPELAAHLEVHEVSVERELATSPATHETEEGWYDLRTLASGSVFSHMLSEVEHEEGVLLAGDDLRIWARLADGAGLRLARSAGSRSADTASAGTDGRLHVEWESDRLLGETVLTGPEGWLDGFAPDDLLLLRLRGDTVEMSATTPEAIPVKERAESLLRMVQTCTERAMEALGAFAAQVADDPDVLPAVPLDEVLADILVDRPETFAEPLLPVAATLLVARMEVVDGLVALGGAPWNAEDVADLEPADILRFGVVRNGLWSLEEDSDPTELLQHLADSEPVLIRIAEEVEQAPLGSDVLDRLRGSARGTTMRAAVALLAARSAEGNGRPAEAAKLTGSALDLAPDLLPALCDAAEYAATRGDAVRADSLLRRAGCPSDVGLRPRLRSLANPPAGTAGRNQPCPCGSGLKYKKCCLNRQSHPLPARASLLYGLLLEYAHRARNHNEVEQLLENTHPEHESPVMDLALFEGGLVQNFLAERGDLLRADERELAERWRKTALRLYEVVSTRPGQEATVRPLLDGQPLVLRDRTLSRDVRRLDLLLARPLDDGAGEPKLFSEPLHVDRARLDEMMSLLTDEADPYEIAAFFSPHPPSEPAEPIRVRQTVAPGSRSDGHSEGW